MSDGVPVVCGSDRSSYLPLAAPDTLPRHATLEFSADTQAVVLKAMPGALVWVRKNDLI